MNKKERKLIAAILFGIVVMVTLDLFEDSREGAHWAHLLWEMLTTLTALFGVFYLMRNSFNTKHLLADEKQKSKQLQQDSEKWREQSKKYVDGFEFGDRSAASIVGTNEFRKRSRLFIVEGYEFKRSRRN